MCRYHEPNIECEGGRDDARRFCCISLSACEFPLAFMGLGGGWIDGLLILTGWMRWYAVLVWRMRFGFSCADVMD